MTTTSASVSARGDFTSHQSNQDASINWTRPGQVGMIEARYVRRNPDCCVVYLSSQTGCDQACRMCHLTATGQTRLENVKFEELLEQADTVLEYYQNAVDRREAPPAKVVHFNFMARGEPLANPYVLSDADRLLEQLAQRAVALGLRPRYLISTIFPRQFGNRSLEEMFVVHHPEIYYSLYSVKETFRRRWLPKSLPFDDALDRLVAWQRHTSKIPKIHYAFIKDENDSQADVHAVCDALAARRLAVNVNIVRYNTFDPQRFGEEPAEEIIHRNAEIFASRLPTARVRIIPRVGFDVFASCGMFFS